ncbi:MAG TPA: polysaccharide deacetylase family protein [Acidimicrobiales bacterium]|nr:polysaccharide deacetylase family protein [Acidimicrobiales bacterium]
MSDPSRPCLGCEQHGHLNRRRFLTLLATGASLALAGCTTGARALSRTKATTKPSPLPLTPVAPPAPILADANAGPPLTLGQIPPARPGAPVLVWHGPAATQQIALTIDDGYCADCIAKYVDFASSSGIHITFNPNGVYDSLWTPQIVETLQPLIANKQVQIGNHTWDHADLRPLSAAAIATELNRNEEWIQTKFGITSRPWFRPPFGYYNQRINTTAANLGFTNIMMWNGSFGDSEVISPQQLMNLAQQYLTPGTIVLGHLNHPTVLSLFGQIQSLIAERNLDPVTLDEMFGTSRITG